MTPAARLTWLRTTAFACASLMLVVQVGLGLAQFAAGLPVEMVLAHNLTAMLMLALALRETRPAGA